MKSACLFVLSCGALCSAAEKKESKKFDAIAFMNENDENKILENLVKKMVSEDQQDNQKKFGRGSFGKNLEVEVQRGGKYVATPQGIRCFGRGSSGPGEGEMVKEMKHKL